MNFHSRIYHDPSGYGSTQETTPDAKMTTIVSKAMLNYWFDNNLPGNKQVYGQNSSVPNGKQSEYKLDFYQTMREST